MAAPSLVAFGTPADGVGNITPTLPAGWQENDIFLLFLEARATNPISTPSGWAHITGSPFVADTGTNNTGTSLTVFWRRATASESDPTITDPGDHVVGVIGAWRGCPTSGDPWDVISNSTYTAGSTTSASVAGATTTGDDRTVIVALATNLDTAASISVTWTNGDLSGLATIQNIASSAGDGGTCSIASGGKATAGAYGTTSITLGSSVISYAGATIALKPATTTQNVTKDSTGSIAYSGTGTSNKASNKTASGSIAFSGAATFSVLRNFESAGSIEFSGASTQNLAINKTSTGQIDFSGTASTEFVGSNSYTFSSTGSMSFSGTAPIWRARTKSTSGSYSFTSSATIARKINLDSVGSLAFTGAATKQELRPKVSTGAIAYTGAAEVIRNKNFTASGVLTFNRGAVVTAQRAGASVWNKELNSSLGVLDDAASVWSPTDPTGVASEVGSPNVWGN